jgi:hypothetical protein
MMALKRVGASIALSERSLRVKRNLAIVPTHSQARLIVIAPGIWRVGHSIRRHFVFGHICLSTQ